MSAWLKLQRDHVLKYGPPGETFVRVANAGAVSRQEVSG
jgi:hypothetical protein